MSRMANPLGASAPWRPSVTVHVTGHFPSVALGHGAIWWRRDGTGGVSLSPIPTGAWPDEMVLRYRAFTEDGRTSDMVERPATARRQWDTPPPDDSIAIVVLHATLAVSFSTGSQRQTPTVDEIAWMSRTDWQQFVLEPHRLARPVSETDVEQAHRELKRGDGFWSVAERMNIRRGDGITPPRVGAAPTAPQITALESVARTLVERALNAVAPHDGPITPAWRVLATAWMVDYDMKAEKSR